MATKYFEKAEKKYFSVTETKFKKDKSENKDIKKFNIPTDEYGNSKMRTEITEYEIKN